LLPVYEFCRADYLRIDGGAPSAATIFAFDFGALMRRPVAA
jgi:hypothetical protein